MKYFVSYTLKDNFITFSLLENLSCRINRLANCYVDILDNDSKNKQERVIKELKSANAIIIIETPNVYKSDWVLFEIDIAIKRKIPIITIHYSKLLELADNELYRIIC